MSLLEIIILLPLLGAALIGFGAPARLVGRSVALINLLLGGTALALLQQGKALTSSRVVLDAPKIAFSVGLDGLSGIMLLLTVLVTLAAIWQIIDKPAIYYTASLLISGGALGAFLSTDLFFMYGFHELALIPTLLMIAIHGHGDATTRRGIAWKITVYLGVGSLILLAGLAALVIYIGQGATFDLAYLQQAAAKVKLPAATQGWIFFILLIGFGTLVSLFPMHSWAAPAYASAPTPVAMLHAGVLKKFGLYGLIKVALPLLPLGAKLEWLQNALLLMLVGNIIVIGLVTIHQDRLDTLLGNSSVMHMGYLFLGLAAGSQIALNGVVLLMFAHGISIALLFAICGKLRNQLGTLQFDKLGGLAANAPFLSLMFAFGAFASIGLPGLANFAGEVMVFVGTFDPSVGSLTTGLKNIHWATIFGLWGVVMSAVYMLRAYRKLFFGKPSSGLFMSDLVSSQRLPFVLLAVVLLVAGCYPGFLTGLIHGMFVTAAN